MEKIMNRGDIVLIKIDVLDLLRIINALDEANDYCERKNLLGIAKKNSELRDELDKIYESLK